MLYNGKTDLWSVYMFFPPIYYKTDPKSVFNILTGSLPNFHWVEGPEKGMSIKQSPKKFRTMYNNDKSYKLDTFFLQACV